MRIDHGHVAIFKIDYLAGVFHDRGAVRADEVLVVANPDEQGAALLGKDDLVGFVGGDDGQGVGTHHVGEGDADGLGEVALLMLVDIVYQMDQHFCIGFTLKDVASLCQFLTQGKVVLDDAIVDDGDTSVGGKMRVGVGAVRLAVGGPARVPDTRVARHILCHTELIQLVHAAPLFVRRQPAILNDGDTGTIVPAVFQTFKSFY